MNCLKCGKEINDGQVFCPNCLNAMEQYPVKPDTPVHLPNRTETPTPKQRRLRFRHRNKDVQLRRAQKTIRILIAVVIGLVLLLSVTTAYLVTSLKQNDSNIGRNYTYEDSGE